MLFSSSIFLFYFLPFILFVYYVLLRRRQTRNVFLLLASLFFYAWGEPYFVLVMMLSILGNWGFGLAVDRFRTNVPLAKLCVAAMLLFNLTIFFIFKYLMFTLENVNEFFAAVIPVPEIALPIGISFFTFQAVSYVLDVYRNDAEVQRSPLKVGLYIALFPQLIAGPIVRYKTIADQIDNRRENVDDFSQGCCRFIVGFVKKMLLANTFALVADTAFTMPQSEMSVFFAWMGCAAYTLQIYFDFSGYSCMAIGLGRMFGFRFLENFNHPYIALSVSDFWRRWHISLSSWFRDYVYFPLGGSRVKTQRRLVFNLFVVWFLTGVWHGANWTFICWGLWYFVLLTVEKLTGFDNKVKNNVPLWCWGIVHHCYVIWAFMMGWVLFRSENLSAAVTYFQTMYGFAEVPLSNPVAVLYFRENFYFWIAGIIFAMPAAAWLRTKFEHYRFYPFAYSAVFLLGFIIAVAYMVKGTYNPFIYFNF
ncbi:MAG: hypothetical protein LBT89_04445 [Planctomycetaceae bacterium]|jgi:alginate O-acetyltransferase complex protein AlgI|nr:hypothetical protein [Planctomycetaceae bacterium]